MSETAHPFNHADHPNPSGVHEVFRVLWSIQQKVRAVERDCVQVRAMLAQMNLPDPEETKCPQCRIVLRGPRSLAEHLYHAHDGPEPAHWLEAEERTG